MGSLAIRLLGPPSIDVDGRPLDVDTRKATALVALLAVAGEPQPRRSLASMLWPETDDERAFGALRRTLSVLRTALGDRWLETGAGGVALTGPGLEIDLAVERSAQERLAACRRDAGRIEDTALCDRCLADLRSIVALHRGPFLAGFALRDSPEFDDWQASVAHEAERRLAAALDRLAGALAAGGHPDEAIPLAERRLALDPLNEAAHRSLMRLHAAMGDRNGAIRRYRECVRVLDSELSVEPLPETTELYRAIAAGELGTRAVDPRRAATPEPVSARRAAAAPAPFVGRDDAFGALFAAWRDAAGHGRFALVEGEPGIGKTRLAEELAAAVRAGGGTAITVRCYREEAVYPYAAAIELLRALAAARSDGLGALAPHVRAELARLLPEAGDPAAAVAVDDDVGRARFVEALAAAVVELASLGELPSLVTLDDAQWLDAPSAQLLARVRRRLDGARLLLLVCATPGAEAAALAAEGLHVTLERLGAGDVAELGRRLGLPEVVAPELYAASAGVPLYLAERLAAGAAAQDSRDAETAARSLVEVRLAGLSEAARQVLAAAAVIGRSFEPDLVRQVSGRSDDEAVTALEELAAAGIVGEHAGASAAYDFDHPRTRDTVYGSLGLARRRLLHLRAAEALQQAGGERRGRSVEIARHYRAAGRETDAAAYLADAAAEAERVFANDEALELLRAAMALDPSRGGELRPRAARLATRLGRYDEAIRDLETALASGVAAGNPALAALEAELGSVHARRGEWTLAEMHLAAALEALPGEAAGDRARVLLEQALVARRRGDAALAAGLVTESLPLAEAAGSAEVLAEAHNAAGMLARGRGERDVARRHLERSVELSASAGSLAVRAAALNNLALLERDAGNLDEATGLTEAALRICIRTGDRHREAALRNNLADLLHAAGRAEQARTQVRESVAILAALDAEPGGEANLNPELWRLVDW